MSKGAVVLFVVLANVIAGLSIAASHIPELVSSATTPVGKVYGPVLWAEILCVAIMLAVGYVFLVVSGWKRLLCTVVWVLAVSTAAHRFTVEIPGGHIMDFYMLVKVQKEPITVADYPPILPRRIGLMIRIDNPNHAKPIWIFAPVPFTEDGYQSGPVI